MAKHLCSCGAKYKLPDTAIGKKAKCKHCGAVFTVRGDSPKAAADSGGASQTEPDDLFAEIAAAAARGRAQPAIERRAPVDEGVVHIERAPSIEHDTRRSLVHKSDYAKFLGEILKAMQFPFSVSNLIIFGFVLLLLCVKDVLLPAALCLGSVGILIMAGWYSSYRMAVIAEASAGNHDLPPLAMSQGFVDDIALPFFRWLGSWIFVLMPAIFYGAYLVWDGAVTSRDLLQSAVGGLTGLMGRGMTDQSVFVILAYAGLAIWPLVILCVTNGDFASLIRVDLIFLTLIRTLPAYILVLAIVFGAFYTEEALNRQMLQGMMGKQAAGGGGGNLASMFGTLMVWKALALVLACYFEIVVCKTIGLYYHCFKERFAWSWG